ncbi:MAG: YciI family protein [Methylococcaceae bacterium]|nr:YciI family protein [Methylococcaceae bacterium]
MQNDNASSPGDLGGLQFAETKETLGGFFLIEAMDWDEAVQIASRWPSARLGSIEVRPIEEALSVESRYGKTP